jgi:site-specific DNA recombinase
MTSLFPPITQSLRAVDYRRVSTEEQAEGGHSLAAQAAANSNYMRLRGWAHVASFEDAGRSGKSIYRPAFQDLLASARRSEFDVVVVHKIDRFNRNLTDFILVLRELKAINVRFVSVSEDIDFTSPTGELTLMVLAWLAQWHLDNLRTEVVKGKYQRVRSGHWNGTLPFGYTTPKRVQKKLMDLGRAYNANELTLEDYSAQTAQLEALLEQHSGAIDTQAIPDPVNAPAVRLVFEKYATGRYSYQDIADMLNEAGYLTSGQFGNNPFGKETIRDMLANRFYLGEVSYVGANKKAQRQTFAGAHAPLIDKVTFAQAHAARSRRAPDQKSYTRRGEKVHEYPLSSLLYCAHCQSRWTGTVRRGQRVYRDSNQHKGIACEHAPHSAPAHKLEDAVRKLVLSHALPQDWKDRIASLNLPDEPGLPDRRPLLHARLQRLGHLYEMGHIPIEDYQRKADSLNRQLKALPDRPLPTAGVSYDAIAAALHYLPALWDVATVEEQQKWLGYLFSRLFVSKGTIVAAEAKPAFWQLVQSGEGENGGVLRRRPDSNW